jgi:hypothetical protein
LQATQTTDQGYHTIAQQWIAQLWITLAGGYGAEEGAEDHQSQRTKGENGK